MSIACFAQSGRGPVDLVMSKEGRYVGAYSGMTQEELRAEYPGIVVQSLESAVAECRESCKTGVKEIDEERFHDALECLPPLNWRRRADGESFMLCERKYEDITSIYVRVGNRFFTFDDADSLKHEDIIARVRQAM